MPAAHCRFLVPPHSEGRTHPHFRALGSRLVPSGGRCLSGRALERLSAPPAWGGGQRNLPADGRLSFHPAAAGGGASGKTSGAVDAALHRCMRAAAVSYQRHGNRLPVPAFHGSGAAVLSFCAFRAARDTTAGPNGGRCFRGVLGRVARDSHPPLQRRCPRLCHHTGRDATQSTRAVGDLQPVASHAACWTAPVRLRWGHRLLRAGYRPGSGPDLSALSRLVLGDENGRGGCQLRDGLQRAGGLPERPDACGESRLRVRTGDVLLGQGERRLVSLLHSPRASGSGEIPVPRRPLPRSSGGTLRRVVAV